MNALALETRIVEFNHAMLTRHPQMYTLKALAKVYSDMWRFDVNFGEFMQCPHCHKYFTQDEVVIRMVTTCQNGHPETTLVQAWPVEEVAQDILKQTLCPGFHGVMAIGGEGEIFGFAWIRQLVFEEVVTNWGMPFAQQLATQAKSDSFMYFDELATLPRVRGQGIGGQMARTVCIHARDNYPRSLVFLRTHRASAAVRIYERMGFVKAGEDTQYGNGRIMMCLHPAAALQA